MHYYASSAFAAMRVWFEVKKMGRRYTIPDVEKAKRKQGIPEARWFAAGAFDRDVPTDGLRDYQAEMNPYLHPDSNHRRSEKLSPVKVFQPPGPD